jgi:hypothetical protein
VVCQKCGTEQAEDSQFCRKCGLRLAPVSTTPPLPEISAATWSESNEQLLSSPSAGKEEKGNSSINFGTLVFASFSVLSLVVCLAKGITLISIAETCVWTAAAIYWHRRSISSPKANLIVLLLAVCVAAGEGYSFGQSSSPNYTYLKEGNLQFRVDSHRGRTDRLFGGGWMPVSFDRSPEALPSDRIPRLVLSNGGWESTTSAAPGRICFDVQNNSDYVVKDLTIVASVHPSTPPSTGPYAGLDAQRIESVVLQTPYLVDSGDSAHLCGTTSFHLSTSDTWSYSDISANGWKQ